MRKYELVLIFNPKLEEEKVKNSLDSVQKLIDFLKGKIKETTDWGKKDLVYPIKKFNQGRYFLMVLDLPSESLIKLSPKFKLEENLIRYLIVKVKKKKR